MSLTDIASTFVNLHGAVKIIIGVIPFIFGLSTWLRLRIKHQRQYIKKVTSLPRYPQYLRDRRAAMRVLDTPHQFRFEALEKRIATELKLNLRSDMTGWVSFINPGQQEYLVQAVRQLSSDTFRSFTDDLLLRLILLLDTLTDYENLRKQSRWTLDAVSHSRQREKLRQNMEEDFGKLDRHIRLMQMYLAGQLDLDLCSAEESGMFRSLLDEKYSAYEALCREDEELAAS